MRESALPAAVNSTSQLQQFREDQPHTFCRWPVTPKVLSPFRMLASLLSHTGTAEKPRRDDYLLDKAGD